MKRALYFVAGAVVGSLVTWGLTKKFYRDIAREEIEGMREKLEQRTSEEESEDEKVLPLRSENSPRPLKPSLEEMAIELKRLGYDPEDDGEGGCTMEDRPYVIAAEDFGEEDGYEVETLLYYADGVLTNENDIPVEDAEDLVSLNALEQFDMYSDDTVYVRNDVLKTDYEILRVLQNFTPTELEDK